MCHNGMKCKSFWATFKLDVKQFSAFIYHHKENVDCTMKGIQNNETTGVEMGCLYILAFTIQFDLPSGTKPRGKRKVHRHRVKQNGNNKENYWQSGTSPSHQLQVSNKQLLNK